MFWFDIVWIFLTRAFLTVFKDAGSVTDIVRAWQEHLFHRVSHTVSVLHVAVGVKSGCGDKGPAASAWQPEMADHLISRIIGILRIVGTFQIVESFGLTLRVRRPIQKPADALGFRQRRVALRTSEH